MTENYPEPPRTDNLGLALLSEAEDPEDYRDLWGIVLDDDVIKILESELTEGEGNLDVQSLAAAAASVSEKPTDPTDVARKAEVDEKADDPHGDESHDFDELNQGGPLTESLDADGNDIQNVQSFDASRIDLSLAVDVEQSIVGGDPITIDVSGAGVFEVEMDQNAQIDLTGASSSGIYTVTLLFEDKGFDPTWDSAIVWEDAEPPELNDDLVFIQFATRDAGTTWFGRASGVFDVA